METAKMCLKMRVSGCPIWKQVTDLSVLVHCLLIYLLTYLLTFLLTYLLTYSMEQSPSWEANQFPASQEIPRILRNPSVH